MCASPCEYAKGHLDNTQDIKVKDGLWNYLSLTCQLVPKQKGAHECVYGCMCVFMCEKKNKKKKLRDWSRFVFAQSLLFASSADTLLQLQFYGVTFVYLMCYTDLLVHMMPIQIVKHG